MVAFFDELRLHGFVEGQNLAIIPGGLGAGNERVDDHATLTAKSSGLVRVPRDERPRSFFCGSCLSLNLPAVVE
jgi:hypothetical protein